MGPAEPGRLQTMRALLTRHKTQAVQETRSEDALDYEALIEMGQRNLHRDA